MQQAMRNNAFRVRKLRSWSVFPHGNFLDTAPGFSAGMGRRSFIRNALLAVGVAGVPLPGFALLARSGSPGYFDAARLDVLDALAETIIPRTDTPGARDVGVPARIDAIMTNWASPQTKLDFDLVLDDAEAAARAHAGRGLADLPAAQQLEVVTAFDTAKAADPAYLKLKGLVLAFYYLSEPGATQELRYQHVPGAWEPNIPVTADTRAWAYDVGV
jgi:gluconate 2-dehydrogenase gamma chain